MQESTNETIFMNRTEVPEPEITRILFDNEKT